MATASDDYTFGGEKLREKLDGQPSEKLFGGKARSIAVAVGIVASLIILFFLSQNNYLLFHGIVETFSIVIAVAIFAVA